MSSYSNSDEKEMLTETFLEVKELQAQVRNLRDDIHTANETMATFLKSIKEVEKTATENVSSKVATAAAEAFTEQLERVKGVFEIVEVSQNKKGILKFFKK